MDKKDQQFRELMKSYRPPKAPVDFTKKVMEKVHAENQISTVYKPVFNKWFVRLLFAVFAVFLVYSLFGKSESQGQKPEFLTLLRDKIPQNDWGGVSIPLGEWLANVPSVLIFALLAATFLLFIDLFVLKKLKGMAA